MGNIAFYALIFTLFLQFAFGAIDYSGVNRTFLNIYRGVIEASLITVGDDGEPTYPYFDEIALKENLYTYLDENITRYVTHYTTGIYYFDLEDELMCTSHHCSGVKITLNADINYFFHYENAKSYVVNKRN